MEDYSKGKIYKVIDNTNNNIYIGSTVEPLNKRLNGHKNSSCSSKKIIKNGDYKIELIENYKCNNKLELRKREQYWIEKINCINERNAYIDVKKYQSKYYKNYYKINKNKYKQVHKQYNEYKKSFGGLTSININIFKD